MTDIESFLIHFMVSGILFLVMWNLLGRRILRPFFRVVEERDAKTAGYEDLARRKREELNKLEADVRQRLMEARVRGLTQRDELVTRAKLEAQEVRERAIHIAARELGRARQDAEQLKVKNLEEMESEIEQLATLLLTQVAERPSGRTVH